MECMATLIYIMAYESGSDQSEEGFAIRGLVSDHPAISFLFSFILVMGGVTATLSVLGYPELAAITVAWTMLLTGVLVVFGVIPLYASQFLPIYQE